MSKALRLGGKTESFFSFEKRRTLYNHQSRTGLCRGKICFLCLPWKVDAQVAVCTRMSGRTIRETDPQEYS